MTQENPLTPAAAPAPECPLAGGSLRLRKGEATASPGRMAGESPADFADPAVSDWQRTGEYAEAYASFFGGGARGEMLHTPLPAAGKSPTALRAGEPSIPPPAERPIPAAKGKTTAALPEKSGERKEKSVPPAAGNFPGTADGRHGKGEEENSSPPPLPEDGSDIWSRRVALSGLLAIYRVALDGARAGGRGKDGEGGDGKFNPTAANTAIKAIEVANRMMGYAAPAGDEERAEEKADENAFSVAFDPEFAK